MHVSMVEINKMETIIIIMSAMLLQRQDCITLVCGEMIREHGKAYSDTDKEWTE